MTAESRVFVKMDRDGNDAMHRVVLSLSNHNVSGQAFDVKELLYLNIIWILLNERHSS